MRLVVWLFKAIWWIASSPLWLIYWPGWLGRKMVQGVWFLIQWPFVRGGAAQLDRQIVQGGMALAEQIERNRKGVEETTRQEFLLRMGPASSSGGKTRQKTGYRKRGKTRQKTGYRKKS